MANARIPFVSLAKKYRPSEIPLPLSTLAVCEKVESPPNADRKQTTGSIRETGSP